MFFRDVVRAVAPTVLVAGCLSVAGCSDQSGGLRTAITTLPDQPEDVVREVEPWSDPARESRQVTSAGLKRSYIVSVPKGAKQRERLPLILAFHGYREDAERFRQHSQLDRADAVVAFLNGVGNAWAPAPYAETTGQQDLQFVDDVVSQLEGEFSIDKTRVFAAGFSNGGGFAAFVGCQRPQEFSGIATVAGAFYQRVSEQCSQIPMKHVDFHGTADPVISYDGGERHETVYNSTPEMLEESAVRNHCAGRGEDVALSPTVTELTWEGCDAAQAHFRIDGGPHVWPGGSVDGSGLVSAGFATNTLLKFLGVGLS
ncbi:alpha/beta hydrolase family esterase [Corynebacterium fournieri]|uniref:alpha/beta hydrolase family esterase n=1 Tax=Corynebacterium fournieri TaxID=1852390 RepID=UPI000A2F7862|nr:PHB depolymerase family esterase [Corynebacterium fournieri]WJY97530.1 Esterase PHB depolymerase [Corynebacterium fournieri]